MTDSHPHPHPLRIGMIGLGTVGRGVARLLHEQADLYQQRTGRSLRLDRVLVRDVAKASDCEHLAHADLTDDPERFFSEASGLDVVVEVAGGLDPIGGYVERALQHKLHVVTANKSLLAARGPALFATARTHGVCIAFEASCGGGIPCVTGLTQGLMANEIRGLYGILNGTCNYILTQMNEHGQSYPDALADAQRLGYAEADPTLDVTGRDAGQKLAILASLAYGVNITGNDVPCEGIDTLQSLDLRLGRELGYDVKLIAAAEKWPGEEWVSVSVRPCFVDRTTLLAGVVGPMNALAVHGHAVGPTLFYGQGAGQLPTASAIVADLLGVATGWYPAAFAHLRLTPDLHDPAKLVDPEDVESRFYLRLEARDEPGVMAKVTGILGELGISLTAVLQHEPDSEVERSGGGGGGGGGEGSEGGRGGNFRGVPVVVTTHRARQGDVRQAVDRIAALDTIHGRPVLLRILDLPDA